MIAPVFSNTTYTSSDYLDHVVSENTVGKLKTGTQAKVVLTPITPEDIVEKSVVIKENVCLNQFHTGGAISRQLSIMLLGNNWTLADTDIILEERYELDDGGTATVRLGQYIIDLQSVKRTKTYTSFNAYDYFARADKVVTQNDQGEFEADTRYPNKTLADVVAFAAEKAGLFATPFLQLISSHPNNTIKPNMSGSSTAPYNLQRAVNAQATWRDVLSSAAAIVGCALKISRSPRVPISIYPDDVYADIITPVKFYDTISSGTAQRTPKFTFDANNTIRREISETPNTIVSASYSNFTFAPGSATILSQYLTLDLGDNILLPETAGATTPQIVINATSEAASGIRNENHNSGIVLYNADITWFGDPRIEAGDFVTSSQDWLHTNAVSFYVMESTYKPHQNCIVRSFAGSNNNIYSATSYNYGGSTGGANGSSGELAVEIANINSRLAGTSFVVTDSITYGSMDQHGSETFYILTDTDELYFGDDPIGSGTAIAEALKETNNQKEMRVWIGTTAEYKILEDHDAIVPNTLYIRTDETLHPEVFEQMVKDEVLTAMALYEEGGGHIGGDLDQGFISILREINHNKGLRMWVGTTAEYQNLVNSEQVLPNVLYIKTDDNSEEIVAEIRAMAEGLKFLGIVDPTKTLPEILNEYKSTLIQGGYISYKLTIVQNTSIYPEIVPVSTTTSNGALVTVAYSAGLTYFTFYYNGNIYIKALYPASGAPDGYSGTNWIKLADGTDSGWKTLAISGTGFSAGSPEPQYRKIGNKIYMKGRISVDMGSVPDVATVFATLPSGYRPANAFYRLIAGEGDRMARLYVRDSGGVNINYFKEYDGTTVTGAHWIQLDCEFLTD